MRRALLYVFGLMLVTACDDAAPRERAAEPDTAAAVSAVQSAAAVGGRPFRMSGDSIVVDTFVVRHELRDGQLTLTLETDLGDATEVFASVGRPYIEQFGSEEFLIDYYDEAGPVGAWRAGKTIDLAKTDFWAEMKKLQGAMSAQDRAFDVAAVSDDLTIVFRVYPHQPPPFKPRNANLTGKAVTLSQGVPIVESTVKVKYPLQKKRD